MTQRMDTAALLSDALGVAPSEITGGTGFANCPAWDSLAHFRVVLAIEEAIGRPLSPDEIFEMTDYAAVDRILSE